MTQLCRTLHRLDLKWVRFIRLACLRRFFRIVWNHIVACSAPGARGGRRYRRLNGCFLSRNFMVDEDAASPEACAEMPTAAASAPVATAAAAAAYKDIEADADVVSLKVILLGDCHIGKTSFMVKYVGGLEEEQKGLQMTGFNLMDKVLSVRGTRIVYSIWDIGGDEQCLDHLPIACKDAAAVLIMFDLTSRCTLNNAIGWYQKARKWNKTAIPILIGTKFDDFVQLPLEMQWMIVNQARAYGRAMNATLFFSSATHNINVNKIFKFITAKLFNLPWKIERNLNVGEPIIDF